MMDLAEMNRENAEILHQQLELLAEKSKQPLSTQELIQVSEQMVKLFNCLQL